MTVYTIPECAKALKVTERTVYRLLRDGRLKSFVVGRARRISEEQLQEYISFATEEAVLNEPPRKFTKIT